MVTQTLFPVPMANPAFLTDLQVFLKNEFQEYIDAIASGFVFSGTIPFVAASLTHTIPALIAFVGGAYYVSQPDTAKTYTANTRTYVYILKDSAQVITIPGFAITTSGNLLFAEGLPGAAEPPTPLDTERLMVVDTDFSAVTLITDLRRRTPLLAGTLGAVSVKDFGAVGNFVTDDTGAINAAISTIPASGGVLYFPAGNYGLFGEITITNKPIVLLGAGSDLTFLTQSLNGANGITFTCTQPGNRQVGGSLDDPISLKVRGMSILRAFGTFGGTGIRASWLPATDTANYLTIDDVHIGPVDLGTTAHIWQKGLHATNVNGDTLTNLRIYGDHANTSSAVQNPYVMGYGIHYDGDETAGKISHFGHGIRITGCTIGVGIDTWHEGLYWTDFEVAFVTIGFNLNATAPKAINTFMLSNGHINARQNCLSANRVNLFRAVNVECIRNGAAATQTWTGNTIFLTNCGFARFSNCQIENAHTGTCNLLFADPSVIYLMVSNCHFVGATGPAAAIAGLGDFGVITGNLFQDCNTAILFEATAQNCVVGVQSYIGTIGNRIVNAGLNNHIDKLVQSGQGTASDAGVAITFPNTFAVAPEVIAVHAGTLGAINVSVSGVTGAGFVAYANSVPPVAIFWMATSVG